MAVDKSLLNVFLLGLSFMLIFTCFNAMGSVQKKIIDSVKQEEHSDFNANSTISFVIICTVSSILIWAAPSLVSVLGAKITMLIGAVTLIVFTLSFIIPKLPVLYMACVIMGCGEAVIWPGLGSYLSLNSSAATISRDSAIFWALYQISVVFESVIILFAFKRKTAIETQTRNILTGGITLISMIGVVVLVFLPPPQKPQDSQNAEQETLKSPVDAFKSIVGLFFTQNMLLLCVTFFYTGLAWGFCSGVYINCIDFTKNFDNSEELAAISNILIAVGEVLGGASLAILNTKTEKWGRNPIIITGLILHVVAFVSILLNLPGPSSMGATTADAIIQSSRELAFFSAFLLGLGDACYNTQIISMVCGEFSDFNGGVFAIFKFTQTVATIICYEYSLKVDLYVHSGILLFMALFGTFAFVCVERRLREAAKAKADSSGAGRN